MRAAPIGAAVLALATSAGAEQLRLRDQWQRAADEMCDRTHRTRTVHTEIDFS